MKTQFHGALSLLVFLLSIVGTYALAPRGLKFRIPWTRWSFRVSFCWVPWFAALLLLIFQAITLEDIGNGLAGDGSLQPAPIILTYLSLSYLAICCEITGLYSWLALHAAKLTNGKPLLLIITFFGLSGAITSLTSADVSLVALTPMVVYTASAAQLDPMSLAATHLGASAVWGLLVPVAGPANILLVRSFGLTFLGYMGWMLLPTLAAAVVVLGLLHLLLHRRHLAAAPRWDSSSSGSGPHPDPSIVLHDQVGASLSCACLCGCLLCLAAAPMLRWRGWLVACVFAVLAG
ncbi:hypothetical protein Agub_g15216, partial [Astrephomene gubernaculifera]